jgi:probable FeS assembly SUF system protein SufT
MHSQSYEIVTIQRECDATEIPSGRQIILYPGTEVRLTQSLGGSFTVVTHQGIMASITGKDADAIGKDIPEEVKQAAERQKTMTTEEAVWAQLKTCFDPEIPHNIVDLGLVYECKILDLSEAEKKVDIKMTLTAPGCGMGDWLAQDVRSKLATVPQIKEVNVQVVFDPPWNASMMHPALRRSLNM